MLPLIISSNSSESYGICRERSRAYSDAAILSSSFFEEPAGTSAENWAQRGSSGTTAAPLGGMNVNRLSLRPGLMATRVNDMVTVFWNWS